MPPDARILLPVGDTRGPAIQGCSLPIAPTTLPRRSTQTSRFGSTDELSVYTSVPSDDTEGELPFGAAMNALPLVSKVSGEKSTAQMAALISAGW